ncbi:MAG: 2-C-methyl-D-erythritol 4-phosphate cytidylyltransferase [Candidatus Binataceae bacterium]
MTASAIIVAAGSGTRLGFDTPKAFVTLGGRTILWHSLKTFAALAKAGAIVEAVITVPAGMERAARAEAAATHLDIPVKITPGGAERQDSVRIALALTSAASELVVVHDAARPFATADLFTRCLKAASRAGGAVAANALADTLKRVDGQAIVGTIPRAGLWQAQTPQAFRRDLLIQAHERAKREGILATDDADLVERLGVAVEIVESATSNLKITGRADLEIAQLIAARGMR